MIYDHSITDANNNQISMSDYKGKVLLIVNVASKCGFTPQYKGLQSLYEQFHDKGLEILAFPCNQFGKQEPGTMQEIQEFCDISFKVQFPIMNKIEVNGENTTALYNELKQSAPGVLGTEAVKWNFTKFLVNRDGSSITRFAPNTTPESLVSEIEALL